VERKIHPGSEKMTPPGPSRRGLSRGGFLSREFTPSALWAAVNRALHAPLLHNRLFTWTLIVLVVGLFLVQALPYFWAWQYDSPSYYTAAWALRHGADIYDEDAFLSAAAEIFGKSRVVYPFIYPPFFAQLCLPLTYLPPPTFFFVIMAGNLVLLFLCLYLTARLLRLGASPNRLPLVFLFSLLLFNQPLMATLYLGQINFLVLALILGYLLLRRSGRTVPAAVCLAAAVSVKVFPVLFVLPLPLYRKGRQLVAVLAAGAGLLAASILVSGTAPWRSFFRSTLSIFFTHADTVSVRYLSDSVRNLSLKSFLSQAAVAWGFPKALVVPLFVLIIAAAFGLVYLLRRRIRLDRDPGLEGSVFLILTLILAPIGWSQHYAIMILPMAYVFARIIEERRASALPLFLTLSAFIMYIPSRGGFPFNQLRMLTMAAFFVFLLLFSRGKAAPSGRSRS